MILIRNLAFYVTFYVGSVFFVLGAIIALMIGSGAFRRIGDLWSGWHHLCVIHLLGIEVREVGSRIDGPVLYVIKHESFFEAIEMPHLFDNPAGFAKQELFDIPGWGKAAAAYGAIPVNREAGAKALREMLRIARPMIAAGRPLILFPEGTRVPHGTRPPLKAGFAALYTLLKIPVVPVAVNSGPLYHHWLKRRGTITICFGEPIMPGLPREEAEARVHAAINALNAPAPPEHQHPNPLPETPDK